MTNVTPLPLVGASPIGHDEQKDLEAFLSVDLKADWPAIRQCLRCLTQGKVIDAGEDADGRLFVRECTHEERKPRAEAVQAIGRAGLVSWLFTGREAVRAVATLARAKSLTALEAARSLAFTPAALKSRAEWDAWWVTIEAERAERRERKE